MNKKPSSGKRSGNLSQYGLLDIPTLDDGDEPMDMSDDDLDLEAELAAISGGNKKPKPRKSVPVLNANLDALIAESLKDVPSDEDIGSGDEDDPDLLNELNELAIEDEEVSSPPSAPPRASRPAPPPPSLSTDSSTVSLLKDRIVNYMAAEKQAKESGESSRARRFGRGLKTLNDLLKQAKAGKSINEADIPPPVALKNAAAATDPEPRSPPPQPAVSVPEPTAPEPEPEPPASEPEPEPTLQPEPIDPPPPPPRVESAGIDPAKAEGLQFILKRKEEFKAAALACKHAGDKPLALEYLKVVKQFDVVVEAYKSGHDMDLNELPTPEAIAAEFKSQQKGEATTEHAAEPAPVPVAPPEEAGGLITASTVDEALKQRFAAFQQQEAKAKADGNASKARRMGRIVKQYQDAIKLHSAGKPIPVDELPTPLGYGPLPTGNTRSAAAAPHPAPSPRPSPAPQRPRAAPQAPTRHDKQLAFLLHRQKEFKEAAINAKKSGNIEQAKEYLRAAKGFDAVIEAARGGLMVDIKSLPLPPNTKNNIEKTFDMVSTEDCQPPEDISPVSLTESDDDALTKLSEQLTGQLKLCLTNRDHYREMGNIAEMNRFEHLAVKVKQDLDVVVVAKREIVNIAEMNRFEYLAAKVKQDLDVVVVAKSLGQAVPKFHYESMKFSVVQCNTDLNETDLELTIVRGIAYNVSNPKEVDTYVKFEFPYPQDAPVWDRTAVVKDTNSPVYNAVFPLAIQRNARPCQRVFKRYGIKFEVYSRGGWFSKDSLIGTASVKLAPLETQVTLHDAFPLMDGRRPAGGSLEIKLRVRTPILQQQFESTSHRWLVIDN